VCVPVAFFVFFPEDESVDVEPDLVHAAGSIEPLDVALAEVFDDNGRQYAVTAHGQATLLTPTEMIDRSALEQRLRASHELANLGIDDGRDFVLAFADALGQWRSEHRWPRWPKWLDRRLHGNERRRYV
jgi:hypothetical protein